ncbi:hypothetical protein [Methylomonas sp. HYX-M1]|uniref:defense against restriction DarA-related protein n=1 Tax=Methylomonas sp. HYX-M1 TaxID=3139307 RepID=UPI00345BACD4
MHSHITWDSTNSPINTTFAHLLYNIRRSDASEGLVMDAVTLSDILEEVEQLAVFDALVSPYAKLQRKMDVLKGVMERVGGTVKPVAMQLSEPFKQNGVAQVAAVFELSDGQTISIFFHNPDVTPGKIAPTDEMISWKWLLNKKDITIVVAAENGLDLNIKAVAQRVIKLAEKNSAAFARANTKRAENLAAIESLKTEITGLEKELADAQKALKLAKMEAEDRLLTPVTAELYAKIQANPALLGRYGDALDATLRARISNVKKILLGWPKWSETERDLYKSVNNGHNLIYLSIGRNKPSNKLTEVVYRLLISHSSSPDWIELKSMPDDLIKAPRIIAEELDRAAKWPEYLH